MRTTTDAPRHVERLLNELIDGLASDARIPLATYRVQLNRAFTFDQARRVVPYLARLGITDLYASPYFRASPESTHGYDVGDYTALNPGIGDVRDYDQFVSALHEHGMGQLCDFVPNHMGIAKGTNPWWLDVLENGQSSPCADFFDIDWRPLKPELRNKVLLPILGDHYGAVPERGELQLVFADGSFTVHYYETPLPIAPPTYPMILRLGVDSLTAAVEPDSLPLLEFQSIMTSLERLPDQTERDAERIAERQREQVVAKHRLAEIARTAPEVRGSIEQVVRILNGTPPDARSFDLLDQLLDTQSYRLAFWRVAAEEINYRRFFAINELAAIRQEVPAVFDATHALVLDLLAAGKITGLRIDHPDGLWDPAGYFRQLQRSYLLALCRRRFDAVAVERDGVTWDSLQPRLVALLNERQAADADSSELRPLYVVAEKIVERGEALPTDWAIHGTVGYEFAAVLNGLFVDAANRKPFDELYTRFIGDKINLADLVYQKKQLMMRVALASEVNVLARALTRISEQHRRSRDFTLNNLRDALREIIACFPVYRTYTVGDDGTVADRDRRYIESAVGLAKRRNPATDDSVFDFVQNILLLSYADDLTDEQRDQQCRFAMKFQQLTGPVMAKGLEDTAFYIYNRLTSLNEVGDDPARFGSSVADFHRQNAARLQRWPHALLTTSTHDTKRSEDVRARINVLSEVPREWRAAINRWARLNRRKKTKVDGRPAPDRNDEYLLYQTLLGAWPAEELDGSARAAFVERMVAYLLKATREAQVHTSWINPNTAYDEATDRFVRDVLDPSTANPFLEDFELMRQKVAHFGAFNGLAQHLLKLTSPGVPDLYQGTETWDFSLVDPDNRRPVDYQRRSRMLVALRRSRRPRALTADLVATKEDGRIKLFVTQRTLACRAADPELFNRGDYVPVEAMGTAAAHVCGFARRIDDRELIVAVPRLIAGLLNGALVAPIGADAWAETRLRLPGVSGVIRYRNLFTDEIITAAVDESGPILMMADVFATFPVALLQRMPSDETDGDDSQPRYARR